MCVCIHISVNGDNVCKLGRAAHTAAATMCPTKCYARVTAGTTVDMRVASVLGGGRPAGQCSGDPLAVLAR
jgi:hypothetical protein